MTRTLAVCMAAFALLDAGAATLVDTSELVATSTALEQGQAAPLPFTITAAGTYEIVLADTEFPAPVTALHAIVVRDGEVVAEVQVGASQQQSDTFTATAGNYRVHVLGTAGAGKDTGSFSVRVAQVGGGASVLDEAGSFEAVGTDETVFTELVQLSSTITGSYDVQITDLQFPQALTSINATVVNGNVLAIVAEVPSAGVSGLFSVRLESGGATVYEGIHSAGQVPAATEVTFAATGQYTLTAADAQFPQSLTGFRTLLIQGGTVLFNTPGAMTATPFNAGAGTAALYTQVTPAANVGVGAVRVRIEGAGNTVVFAGVQIGDVDANPSTPSIYSLTTPVIAAGAYRVRAEDFGLPSTLASLRVAATQGDAVLAERINEGQFEFTASDGAVRLLIAAAPASATANGLFGLQLEPQAGGATIVETNQGVGGLFRGHSLDVSTAGSYDIVLTDLRFPSEVQSSMLVITRGTTSFGQVFGGGQLRQTLQPGTYRLNFLGRPAANESYGTYALKVSDSPPLPTITFSANPTSVTTGSTTTLQWTATNATACTASGAWTGSRDVSGSFVTPALTGPSTFELSCSGPGGSSNGSVTVQVTARQSKGGGGSLQLGWMLALSAFGAWRAARSQVK